MRRVELNTANTSRQTPLGAAADKVKETGAGVSATREEGLRGREDECSDGEWLVPDQGQKPDPGACK